LIKVGLCRAKRRWQGQAQFQVGLDQRQGVGNIRGELEVVTDFHEASPAQEIQEHPAERRRGAQPAKRRSERVSVANKPRPALRRADVSPLWRKGVPAGSLKERLRRLSKLQGDEALRATLQSAALRTEAMLNSLPAALSEAAVDAVVINTVLFYIELVPISLGMPYAHVANALHLNYSGHTPLCF
jgi:hypothetical protein